MAGKNVDKTIRNGIIYAMKARVAAYARPTSKLIGFGAGLQELRSHATGRGLAITAEYIDGAAPTSRGRKRLPALSSLLSAVGRGEVDVLLVASLSQLGTSMDSLLDTLAAIHRAGVKLVLVGKEGAETVVSDLPTAGAMLVQARQDYRREAILAGQMRARMFGVKFGRPPLAQARIEQVKIALSRGDGVRATARKFGISPAKASRIKSELTTAQAA